MTDEVKILVIDDEEIVHSSVRRILSRLGYEVDGALTAQDGLEKLAHNRYDAVITDLMMPEMNGIEMIYAMKERKLNVPTIMITGYPTIKTAMQALRLGAVDYIPKPFTRQELLSPLNRALRRCADGSGGECGEANEKRIPPDNVPTDVMPGDVYYLPEHSWALYNQDGTVDVGVERSFLSSVPEIIEIEAPDENDLVEQGHAGFKLKTPDEVHGVFMPFSGRVVASNKDIIVEPSRLDHKTWVLKIIPSQLNYDLDSLRKKPNS